MPPWLRTFKEYAEALLIALILALIIRTFVVQAFKIPSASMLETLQVGDHLLVNKFIYGIKLPFTGITIIPVADPKRGDVVVFEYPENPSMDYIKRIIGIPGDVVELREGVLFINNEAQYEPYIARLPGRTYNLLQEQYGPITVPEEHYFVMGDNRNNSHDSRYWGKKVISPHADVAATNQYTFVARAALVGKAWRIYWSWKKIMDWRSGSYLTDWNNFPPVRFERLGQAIK